MRNKILGRLVVSFGLLGLAGVPQARAKDTAEKPLAAGALAPLFSFTDIQKREGSVEQYRDWIVVYTVADRGSSDPLMAWMGPAGIDLVRQYPTARIARINLADLTAVPGLMSGVVTPILRRIDNKATQQLLESYKSNKLTYNPAMDMFHLIPDWDGDLMLQLGVRSGEQWRVWIAHGGTVVEYLDATVPGYAERYKAAISRLAGGLQ